EAELLGHPGAGEEEEEGLVGRAALEPGHGLDPLLGGERAQAVHRLGRIAQDPAGPEVRADLRNGLAPVRLAHEGKDPARSAHSSAHARSSGVVIFTLRGESGTRRTAPPIRSTSTASSVASAAASAAAWARARSSRGKACGVWARQSRSRDTVRATRRSSSGAASLSVSVRGTAATAPTPVRASRI